MAVGGFFSSLGPIGPRREPSTRFRHGYKPVPVVVHDERVVVSGFLHLALLDQCIESMLYERRRQRQVRDPFIVAMEVAVVI